MNTELTALEETFLQRMRDEKTSRGKDEAIADMKRMGKMKAHIREILEREWNKEKSGIKPSTSTQTQEK
ncbi:hypothetical protein [Tortoise microvirus 19]|nr:hypothetical protein [Tortoise microvirus 19]